MARESCAVSFAGADYTQLHPERDGLVFGCGNPQVPFLLASLLPPDAAFTQSACAVDIDRDPMLRKGPCSCSSSSLLMLPPRSPRTLRDQPGPRVVRVAVGTTSDFRASLWHCGQLRAEFVPCIPCLLPARTCQLAVIRRNMLWFRTGPTPTWLASGVCTVSHAHRSLNRTTRVLWMLVASQAMNIRDLAQKEHRFVPCGVIVNYKSVLIPVCKRAVDV